MKSFVYLIFLLLIMGFAASGQYIPKFDLQGHRGARGIKPENTIPSMIEALKAGVTTLEMDVVITKDKQVILSHEPWLSSEICLKPGGEEIVRSEEKSLNIYQLLYDEVKQYDCGSKGNSKFPEQEKLASSKPLLSDVIIAVEDYIKNFSLYEVDYNIEIKSTPEEDDVYHPKPEQFSDLVYQVIDQHLPWERVVIQSFDFRVLKYWNKKYPHVRLACLVANTKSPEKNIQELGFIPSVYSPYYKLLKKENVDYLHTLQATFKPQLPVNQAPNGANSTLRVRVIPWTVNEVEEMKALRAMGVDGLITDYPNRAADIGLGLKRNGTGQKGSIKK
ncbi:MAG: glycerophosphodiester phosphodiesterase [Cyclobacteriaceae bacterium]|nr:glycerophosphodiester phosphodiesterase [Cyclobacteriaceae bacterium]